MNTEKFLGVRLSGGNFDEYILDCMRRYIELEADEMDTPITKKGLAERLGMDRNRVTRITKALEITSLFN